MFLIETGVQNNRQQKYTMYSNSKMAPVTFPAVSSKFPDIKLNLPIRIIFRRKNAKINEI